MSATRIQQELAIVADGTKCHQYESHTETARIEQLAIYMLV